MKRCNEKAFGEMGFDGNRDGFNTLSDLAELERTLFMYQDRSTDTL